MSFGKKGVSGRRLLRPGGKIGQRSASALDRTAEVFGGIGAHEVCSLKMGLDAVTDSGL